ncbi:uncharacterized protein LOC110031238 [Phalaenopsis equestris]|uniref:uncharacterized protein LOC110031238 n=1 Tax=Phalaenopsis equestris TaxID=78828 RepID=UPI0009E548F2|nr:uncharacterized protein LOC110031238 [Phalaenopsis equestris]
MWKPFGFNLCILGFLWLALACAAENEGNPATKIVNLINANRTAINLRKLHDNRGLGCMALQFISQCIKNCSRNNTLTCHLQPAAITEIYAPNCGVELATIGIISGYLLGCHLSSLNTEQAFFDIEDKRAVSLIHGGDLTELGAGFMREKHGGFYWSVLFSNETSNSSFVLEDGGTGIQQKVGCFSGSDAPCSAGTNCVGCGVKWRRLGISKYTGDWCETLGHLGAGLSQAT